MNDSENSAELSLHVAEFTLEDTLGMLKELKLERDKVLESAYEMQINNRLFAPLSPTTNLFEEQQKLTLKFMNEIFRDKPDDYPIPNTDDMFTKLISELTNEIENIQLHLENIKEKLQRKEEDLTSLKERKEGIEKMKEACLSANKNIASKTYEQELQITKKMFKTIRSEVHQVVTELFKDEHQVKDFLGTLCSAYFTSGDDVYVDLTPEVLDVANYLYEADLLIYHKYDKNKVRLTDL